ncbi:MAG: zinc-ribbon domain-containing protein [bacterium]|nr:zinc-ribbon domain-containing protein [bacterium]
MKICPHCGNEYIAGETFCLDCGSLLEEVER